MSEARDHMTFEQFVKASSQWVKLDRIQRDWVKDVSSGTRRFSFTGRRHGWTTLHRLHMDFEKKVVNRKPFKRERELEHG